MENKQTGSERAFHKQDKMLQAPTAVGLGIKYSNFCDAAFRLETWCWRGQTQKSPRPMPLKTQISQALHYSGITWQEGSV